MIFMASSSVWYDSVRYCSGMPSLTEDPRGKERSWMRRHPVNSPLCFLGTAPRGEQAYWVGKASMGRILPSLMSLEMFCDSSSDICRTVEWLSDIIRNGVPL